MEDIDINETFEGEGIEEAPQQRVQQDNLASVLIIFTTIFLLIGCGMVISELVNTYHIFAPTKSSLKR